MARQIERPSHALRLSPSARKALDRLHPDVAARVSSHLDGMALDPYSGDCKRLSGAKGRWRARVGDWRIIYFLDPSSEHPRPIIIETIGHRSESYRGL